MHVYPQCQQEQQPGGSQRRLATVSPAKTVRSKFSARPCPKNKVESNKGSHTKVTSGFYAHAQAKRHSGYTHSCTHPRACARFWYQVVIIQLFPLSLMNISILMQSGYADPREVQPINPSHKERTRLWSWGDPVRSIPSLRIPITTTWVEGWISQGFSVALAAYWPPTGRLHATYRPPTDCLQTAYRPPSGYPDVVVCESPRFL